MKLKDVNEAHRIGSYLLLCQSLKARFEESAEKGHEFSIHLVDHDFSIRKGSPEYEAYVALALARFETEIAICKERLLEIGVDTTPEPPPEPIAE